jgi:hypothetical protein
MKNKILMAMLQMVITNVIEMCIDKETQLKFIDSMLDSAKAFVSRTDNTLDDKIIVPLCDSIRKNFNIPD